MGTRPVPVPTRDGPENARRIGDCRWNALPPSRAEGRSKSAYARMQLQFQGQSLPVAKAPGGTQNIPE